ncbi:MAG: hypothetical protein IPH20_04900 [Bacteroidales bacterium]|nr:hypothetical protein [Bacteroidales bacterium]
MTGCKSYFLKSAGFTDENLDMIPVTDANNPLLVFLADEVKLLMVFPVMVLLRTHVWIP